MVREVEEQGGISFQKWAATRKEGKPIDRLRKYRVENGVPPWVQMEDIATVMHHRPNRPGYRSSRTVRQGADDYCASEKLLKEFTYEKSRIAAIFQVQTSARLCRSCRLPSHGTCLGRLRRTSRGMSKLVGVREAEWFKEWEGTIRRAVIARQQSEKPMY